MYFEGSGLVECDPLGISEGIRVDNILGILDGEVQGITLGAANRSNIGDDEVSGTVLSCGYFEGARDGNPNSF